MIKLDVRPYCECCPDFTAEVEGPNRVYVGDEYIHESDTIVHCKYRRRCEAMVRYLQKQMEKPKD